MKIIDSFCHILPRGYADRLLEIDDSPAIKNVQKRVGAIPALIDLEVRFRQMDEFGDYRQIINTSAPAIEDLGGRERNAELARVANDGMAGLVEAHPDRFAGFCAAVSLDDVDRAIEEVDYAFDHLGAVGVQIYTHVRGVPMDIPALDAFYDHVARAGKVIQVHPSRNSSWADYPAEVRSKYEIWWALGWEYDLSAFMARIVFSGILERWPELKFLIHHAGSMIPHFSGRIETGWRRLGTRTSDEEQGDVAGYPLSRPPIEYFKMFFADTALFGAPDSLQTSLNFFGPERLLFGTDSPFDPEGGPGFIRSTIGDVDRLNLTGPERASILAGNAIRVMGLT